MRDNDSAIHDSSIAAGGLLAAAGVLCFSFTFPATAWALEGFNPWAVTGLRGLLAAVLAGACLAIRRVPLPRRADWPGLLAVTGGCVIAFPLLSTLALRTASTAHSAVVIGLLPLATAAFAAARGRTRLGRAFWLAALTGAAVVVAFALQQGSGRLSVADMYLLGALAVCAAGYAEGGRLARHMPGWQVIAWALVAALPVTALTCALALPAEPVRWTVHGVAGLAYLAVVSQFGGFLAWYRGLALLGVARASQLQLAQPLLTLVWSVLILGEHLPPTAPAAAVAVIACIAVTQRRAPGPSPASPGPSHAASSPYRASPSHTASAAMAAPDGHQVGARQAVLEDRSLAPGVAEVVAGVTAVRKFKVCRDESGHGLGASLYMAVEGRAPFERADAVSSLTAVVADTLEPPSSAGPLWPVISGLLSKDPDSRLSADEADHMLRQVATGTGATGTGATGDGAPTRWLGAPVPPPPGYSRFKGPGGFSIGVPEGWKTSQAGHVVSVTDPANSNVSLLIAQAKSPSKDSSKDPLAGLAAAGGQSGGQLLMGPILRAAGTRHLSTDTHPVAS